VLPDPFREKGAWKNSTETQQFGHAPRSGLEVKNGRSTAKLTLKRLEMWDNPEGGELYPAEGVEQALQFSFRFILLGKRTREGRASAFEETEGIW